MEESVMICNSKRQRTLILNSCRNQKIEHFGEDADFDIAPAVCVFRLANKTYFHTMTRKDALKRQTSKLNWKEIKSWN